MLSRAARTSGQEQREEQAMSRNLRLYYYAILGAIGGLIAWRVTETFTFLRQPNIYLTDLLSGAVIGLCIGFVIGMAEAMLSKSLMRGLRAAAISGGIGLV